MEKKINEIIDFMQRNNMNNTQKIIYYDILDLIKKINEKIDNLTKRLNEIQEFHQLY